MPNTKTHVMVVDDEPVMRGMLKDFLESQGYKVSCFGSAGSALDFIRQGVLADVIISDIRMIPMDGIDFLQRVKKETPGTPVLLFTAQGCSEERAKSLALGAETYLFKPFPLTELKDSIERALGTKILAGAVAKKN